MAERPNGRRDGLLEMRTSCGRRIAVGQLLLGEAAQIGRVTLRLACERAEQDQLWTGLTAAEARRLAGYLLAQADIVEHGWGDGRRL